MPVVENTLGERVEYLARMAAKDDLALVIHFEPVDDCWYASLETNGEPSDDEEGLQADAFEELIEALEAHFAV